MKEHEQRFRYNTRSSNKPPQQLDRPLCSPGASAEVPSMARASTPPFLRFLSHLDGHTWAYVLLSKLIDQGSAAAVALTCSQLRKLCQGEIQNVDLLRLHSATAPKSYKHVAASIVPVLARLPKLNAVDLAVGGSLMRRPMANLLCSFRTQLTQSKCLQLKLAQDWTGAVTCWRELGRADLMGLYIYYGKVVTGPYTPRDLLHLSALRGLQDLVLSLPPTLEPSPAATAAAAATAACPQPWLDFAAGLTSLTALQAQLPSNLSIAGIAGCTGLFELVLGRIAQAPLALKEEDWDAVGNLTQLTQLNVCADVGGSKCMQAFARLGRLQYVVADFWEPDIVIALSQLQVLTCIEGSGREPAAHDSPHLDRVTCPSVAELLNVSGHPPVTAFPNMRVMSHASCICIPALLDLPHHCQGLCELWADAANSRMHLCSSLRREEPCRDRVSAIMALTQLQQLQVLG